MSFLLAVGSIPTSTDEKAQLDQLIRELRYEFETSAEKVGIAVNVRVCGEQVDGILWKDGTIVVLELKSVSGRINANVRGKRWSVLEEGRGRRRIENPFAQVARKRVAVAQALGRVDPKLMLNADRLARGEGLPSWVVVNSDARVIRTNFTDEDLWFDAIPLSDFVRRARDTLGTILPVEHLDSFLRFVGADVWDVTAWLERRSDHAARALTHGPVPTERLARLDAWLHSSDPNKTDRALVLIGELDLRAYAHEILSLASFPNAAIQTRALNLILSWKLEGLESRLAELSAHRDPRIRQPVLKLLAQEAHPEAVESLMRVIREGDQDEIPLAIGALGRCGGNRARGYLIRLLQENLKKEAEPGSFPIDTLVAAVGEASATQAVNLLLAALDWPSFQSHKPGDWEYERFRESVVLALGKIRSRRAMPALLRELDDDRRSRREAALEALGFSRLPGAVPHLLPFLDSDDPAYVTLTIRALRRIAAPSAFGKLFQRWTEAFEEEDPDEREYIDALIACDPRKLEAALPSHVLAHRDSNRLYLLFWTWQRIVSPASRESLLTMIVEPDLAEQAAGLLMRVATSDVIQKVRGLLSSASGPVRGAALGLIVETGDVADLLPDLNRLKSDDAPEVRIVVVYGYSKLPMVEARKALIAMAVDSLADVRRFVLVTLARLAVYTHHRVRWTTSARQGGEGMMCVTPEAVLLESADRVEVIGVDTVRRVGLDESLAVAGGVCLKTDVDGRETTIVLWFEVEEMPHYPEKLIDDWYEAIRGVVLSAGKRRVDLGTMELGTAERAEARALVELARSSGKSSSEQ